MSSMLGKEILLIDDAPDIRRLVRKILENDGAVVKEASSVAEGLMISATWSPHMIFLDLQFPEGEEDGFAFLEEFRKCSQLMVPIVVLSGRNDKGSVVRAISLGAVDYLIKPFRASQLLQKTRKALKMPSFQSHVFAEGARPRAKIHVQGEIQKLSEGGFWLEAGAKLGRDSAIEVSSELLKRIGAESVVIKTAGQPPAYNGQGRFVNELVFSGVGDEFTRKVRRSLKGAA